jgi:hypothetical protein
MKKEKSKEQYRTETIAETGGLQTDNRMYYDPMYESGMYGSFLRSLYNSKEHARTKIVFSIFFLIVPTIITNIIFTQQAFFNPGQLDYGDKIGTLFYVYPLSILIYFIAVKILISIFR